MFIDVNPLGIAPHPMHMHGHKFFVVAMERHVDNITLGTYLDDSGYRNAEGHDKPKISMNQILLTHKKYLLMHISTPSISLLLG